MTDLQHIKANGERNESHYQSNVHNRQ